MIRSNSFKISQIIRHPNASKYPGYTTEDKFSSFNNSYTYL